jgi:type VI secretion system protein VasJ
MTDLAEIRTLGQTPIPGDKPGGESVMLDPGYEAMRTEVQKLDSVNQEPVNWSSVVDTGIEILEKRSKNLLAATYLTLGLFEKHGYEGMAAGLQVCRDLVSTFWEVLDPPPARKRGRIEAFVWLNERAGKSAANKDSATSDKETLQECVTLVGALQSALAEKLGDDAPGFGDLEREVKTRLKTIESDEKAGEARRQQQAKVAAGEIDETTSPDQARQVLGKLKTTIHKISGIIRKGSLSDPVPYRLNRTMAWGTMTIMPPNNKGLTQISAPTPELSGRLLELYTKGEWTALVESSESAFPNAPLWLDLQRWIAQGLGTLGQNYVEAQDAVVTELSSLVGRMPELIDLSFAGGIPFASPETLKWLKDEVISRRGGSRTGSGTSEMGGEGSPEGLAEAATDARKMAGRGQFAEAVRKMQEGIHSTGEHRGQFLWRLEMARICLESNQPQLAAPLLEELETYIQRHQLEIWEPRLCLAAYIALLSARRMLMKDQRRATPDLAQKANQLHERIARLDLATALSLDGK